MLENQQTGETLQESATADANGEWFYQYNGFLTPGNYLLWAQTKYNGQQSAPSPEVKLTVEKKAFQIGSLKLTFTTFYSLIISLLVLLLLILIAYIIYHHIHAKRKHKILRKNLDDAQASIQRGFALLNRDLVAELDIIHKVKLSKGLSLEEQKRENQLESDLKYIERYLSKEIWEVEDAQVHE